MAIVKISDLPLVDAPVEGTDLFVVVQDNVTKKAYASDIQTYVGFEEVQTATAGQTVFNLTQITYAAGANNLQVFVDGVNQYEGSSYTETDNNTVTFSQGLHEGALVKFSTVQTQTSLVNNAGAVVYSPAGTGAVPTNVQTKLRETVSVKDFGAQGDGVANDTAAFTACRTATSGKYLIPPGTYVLDASPNVWEDVFIAPYGGTSLVIAGISYDISGSFASGWKNGSPNQTYLQWTHARTGAAIARWSDGASSGDSNRFYLPFDIRRDSHFFIAAPGTNNGSTDLLWRRSSANPDANGDRFQMTFSEGAASDTYSMLFATTASGSPSFDVAYDITNGTTPKLRFLAAPVECNQTFSLRKRTPTPTYKWTFAPDATTMAFKSQDLLDVDQATLMNFGQYTATVTNKRYSVFDGLPFTGRSANGFAEAGTITSGASRTFPIVGASNIGFGTVLVSMVGSSSGERYYKADFTFDGTTLTTDTSTLNGGNAALTVSFSVVSGQVELTLGYTGGIGGSSRYAVDVTVNTLSR